MEALPLRKIKWFILGAVMASPCLGATFAQITSGSIHFLTVAGLATTPYSGFGINAGGGGGEVYTVTSLADSGAGTLRNGVISRNFNSGNLVPRKIVFAVGGDITLTSTLEISSGFLTIDGSTAPSPGITIRKNNPALKMFLHNASNVIVTYVRFIGNNSGTTGSYNLSLQGCQRVIIDHVTTSNADDVGIGIVGGNFDITVSWCMIYNNPKAMIISYGPNGRISLHRNVMVNNAGSVPELRYENQTVDIVNNVISHWFTAGSSMDIHVVEAGAGYGNGASSANIINNAFTPYSLMVYGDNYGVYDDGGPEFFIEQGYLWTPLEGTLMGQLYVSGNRLLFENLDHYSTVNQMLAIPANAQAIPYDSNELGVTVVPYVGTVYPLPQERELLNLLFVELGGSVPSDLNNDGLLDAGDVDFMRNCRTRAGVPQTNPACAAADLDGDGDVDQSDFGALQLKLYNPDYLSMLNPANPVIAQGQVTILYVTQNTSATFQLAAASGQGGSDLNWQINSPPQVGSASIVSGSPSPAGTQVTLSYQPAPNYTGSDMFVVDVDDGLSPVDSITVQVIVSEPHQAGFYYVDANHANASDLNTGTQTLPFKTIQKAANMVQPGDTVLIKSGTYHLNGGSSLVPVFQIKRSGTPAAPITFAPFQQPGGQYDTVIIDGQNGATQTLAVVRASYINIERLELRNAKRTAIVVIDDNVDGLVDAHHVNIRLCYAHHNTFEPSTNGVFRTIGPVEHVVFEDCMAHDNSIGFELREHPTQSRESMSVPPIAGNIGHPVNLPESQWDSWPGWVGYAARYCVVRRCISFDNRLVEGNSDGVSCRYAIECIFEDNIAYGNVDDNYDLLGATRCIARRNIGFDGDPENTPTGNGNGLKMGVRGGLDNVVHHNIMFENRDGGIDMTDTERAKVYNNTCFKNLGSFGILFEGRRATIGGHTGLNNICKGHPSGDIVKHDLARITRTDYNCVNDNNTIFPTPQGPNGYISTNPQFKNENMVINRTFPAGLTIPQKWTFLRDQVHAKLGLVTGSPCVNTAEVISGITGTIIGSGPDRGAVESH